MGRGGKRGKQKQKQVTKSERTRAATIRRSSSSPQDRSGALPLPPGAGPAALRRLSYYFIEPERSSKSRVLGRGEVGGGGGGGGTRRREKGNIRCSSFPPHRQSNCAPLSSRSSVWIFSVSTAAVLLAVAFSFFF